VGKVLPAVIDCAAERFDCLALVKPQFELDSERVGKGGVVRSAEDRRAALLAVGTLVRDELGLSVLGYASSGLAGPAGNQETFVWIAEPGREGALDDLEAAARRIEP
jgi:23S rRNA (cytidine1920-2'-O)/16S rRNA (cytidine1409-2'-O)-methyltransferase